MENKTRAKKRSGIRRMQNVDVYMERQTYGGKGKRPFIDFGIVGEESSDSLRDKYPQNRIQRMTIFEALLLADQRLTGE